MYFYANTFTGSVKGPQNLYPDQGNAFRFNGNSNYINLVGNRFLKNDNVGLEIGGENVDQLTIVDNSIIGNAGPAVTRDYFSVGPFRGHDLLGYNKVSDNGGNFQLASVGFSATRRPEVTIAAPQEPSVGQEVNFSFQYVDDGTPAHVLWISAPVCRPLQPTPVTFIRLRVRYRWRWWFGIKPAAPRTRNSR